MSVDERISKAFEDLLVGAPFSEPRRTSLRERMHALAAPGVSMSVVDNFELVWAQGIGNARAGSLQQVDNDTIFQAGSISKPVFALAVMKLAQSGRIDLDADIGTYLRSWQIPPNRDWHPRVTLRQLLSHTAGTTVHGFVGYPVAGQLPTLIQILDGTPPANSSAIIVDSLPGLQFRYSGGGTLIAQLAITDLTGKSFPDLMRELIFDPLDLNSSTYDQALPQGRPNVATGHFWNGERVECGWHVYPEMAAAGLWTTASDLGRLAQEILRTFRGDPSPLGIRPENLRSMIEPQLKGQSIGDSFVGLSWFCAGAGDQFQFGHQGWNEGFVTELRLYPRRGQAATVMVNSNQGGPLRNELIEAIGREFDFPRDAKIEGPGYAGDLSRFRGSYADAFARVASLVETEKGLQLELDAQRPISLKRLSETEFTSPAVNMRITFEREASGLAERLVLVSGETRIVFDKR